MRKTLLSIFSLLILQLASAQISPSSWEKIKALPQAHAHNDYEHPTPLWDALSHGFTSIEVDVFPIGNELYVAHNLPANPQKLPTLRELYLSPLQKHIRQHGSIYKDYTGNFFLMIDIKREGEKANKILNQQLQAYLDMVNPLRGPVRIFLSGTRPAYSAQIDSLLLAKIDGRPDDLGKGFSSSIIPVISQRYGKLVSWRGMGEMPAKDQAVIKQLCEQAHREGKRVRLWATPEKEKVWQKLLDLGVDFINTDELERLANFFHAQEDGESK